MSGFSKNPSTPSRPSIREQIAAKRAEIRNTPGRGPATPRLGQADGFGSPSAAAASPARRAAAPTPAAATPSRGSGRFAASSSGFGSPARRSAAGAGAGAGAAGRGTSGVNGAGVGQEMVEDKNAFGEIAKAVKSGKLDLSSLSLRSIPHETYTTLLGIALEDLSMPPPKSPPADADSRAGPSSETPIPFTPSRKGWDSSDLSSAGLSRDEERALVFGAKAQAVLEAKKKLESIWREPEELTVLRVAFNRLEGVEREVGMFGGLKMLDLSHNRLKVVPDTFADLLKLTTLDLSNNTITSLPQSILLLPLLQVLDLSHNSLTSLSFDSPIKPSEDGLGYGIGFFTSAFARAEELKADRPIWPCLRSLNLGHNQLRNDALYQLGKQNLPLMRVLNVEYNSLQGELDVVAAGLGRDRMPQLATLVLSHNHNLRAVSGEEELAAGIKVETVGCNLRQPGTPMRSTPTAAAGATAGEPTDSSLSAASTVPTDSIASTSTDDATSDIPSPDLTIVYRTLPAATFDSEPLQVDFDLYLPPTSTSTSSPSNEKGHPLVIWFHGGGLLQGNKENLPPHFRRLPSSPLSSNQAGDGEHIAVISPNYRLAPQVPILDILSDITSLLSFISTKLNDHLLKSGRPHKIDTDRICLSGGSAGGYLALMAGLEVPQDLEDEVIGGYRGLHTTLQQGVGIKCLAPFYPITDLTHEFWATKTDPVPWMNRSVPHAEAKPHIDTRSAPCCSAVSGGPRSILYPYMLQHALFPSLLFLNQRSLGSGLEGYRPTPEALSVPNRLRLTQQVREGSYPLTLAKRREKNPKPSRPVPIYYVWGTADDKVQPQSETVDLLREAEGEVREEIRQGADHAFDEDPGEKCDAFRGWLASHLL